MIYETLDKKTQKQIEIIIHKKIYIGTKIDYINIILDKRYPKLSVLDRIKLKQELLGFDGIKDEG